MGEGLKTRRGNSQISATSYIYKDGNEFTSLTGGWTSTGYTETSGYIKGNIIKNIDNIEINASTPTTHYLGGTTTPISLTEISVIKANVYSEIGSQTSDATTGTFFRISIRTEKTSTTRVATYKPTLTEGQTTNFSLDVSSLSGIYYIYAEIQYPTSGGTAKKVKVSSISIE